MKRPSLALEFSALRRCRFQREFARRASPRIREFAVEEKPHFYFVADRMEFGVHCLVKFSQSPDSLISHALSWHVCTLCTWCTYIPGGVNRPSTAVHPPSAKSTVPVTKLAASDARKSVGPTISSARAHLFNALLFAYAWCQSAFA